MQQQAEVILVAIMAEDRGLPRGAMVLGQLAQVRTDLNVG